MHDTTPAPGRLVRRTRVVATVGPASDGSGVLEALIAAGVDVFRISASHDPVEVVRARVAAVRAAAAVAGADVAVMVDLCGPKLRCIPQQSIVPVDAGARWHIVSGEGTGHRTLGSTVPAAVWSRLSPGTVLTVGDGALSFDVLEAHSSGVVVTARTEGILRGRPGLHVPSDLVPIESPTDDDRLVLTAAVADGVDAVAVSFVRCAADVRRVRELAPEQLVVAKIETAAAVRDLDAIIAAADAVMVARGDLGLEFPLAEVPFLQRRIIHAAVAAARPVITATQMLESMVAAPVPTRAEAADVVGAVLDGTSAVMLSAETAVGVDPVAAATTMATLAARADLDVAPRVELPLPATGDSSTAAATHAVSEAAHRIATLTDAVAVVGLTESGFTARALSRWRSPLPLVAAVTSTRVARQLRLSWGVTTALVRANDAAGVLDELTAAGVLPPDAPVVVVSGVPGGRASDTVRVCRTPPVR